MTRMCIPCSGVAVVVAHWAGHPWEARCEDGSGVRDRAMACQLHRCAGSPRPRIRRRREAPPLIMCERKFERRL
jgi:hypothetical protein